MPLDPRAKRFLDVLAATNPPSARSLTVGERRQALAQLMILAGADQPIASVQDRTLPGTEAPLRARIYTPLEGADAVLPGLVYFHGGGLVAGSIDSHDRVARALANAGRCRIVSVDYRLAPEHPFPAAIDDAMAAVRFVRAESGEFGIDPARFGIAGDSAGATLAAVVCQSLAAAADDRLALQLLLCPIMDYAGMSESRRTLASGYLLDQSTLDHDLAYYLPPGLDPADPRVSPLRALDLAGLPRTVIHTAEYDPLRDEAVAYAERLRLAGTPVSCTVHTGMIHLFYAMAGVIPYSRTAFDKIGTDIRAALS